MSVGIPLRHVGESEISRPYVISVDGDIPAGAGIKVVVNGMIASGLPWQREYINPIREPLITPRYDSLSFYFFSDPHSLAVPFLYAITIEGDKQKWEYDAEALAKGQDVARFGWCLMRPKEGRAFISEGRYRGAHVSASTVGRPWVMEVDGYAAPGAALNVYISGDGSDGSHWKREFKGRCSEVLPDIAQPRFAFDLLMNPTPDGVQSPSLCGIAIEGDGRRFYIQSAILAGGLDMSRYRLLRVSEDESILTLQWIVPPFAGQPPTILNRLRELFDQGKLRPGAPYFDE